MSLRLATETMRRLHLKPVLRWLLIAGSVFAAVTGLVSRSVAAETFIVIGTGGVAAVYYPAGGAICRMVNNSREAHGVRCLVESTGGSIANIERIRSGDLQFGFAQSDWQFHAYRGTDRFAQQGAFEDLRAVFSLHPEPFTIVAGADSGISHLDDLKGKRVNIGNRGSGQRATMEVVMDAKGWSLDDFADVSELTSTDQSSALCDGTVDAIVMTVGHPSASIQHATTACSGVIVEVSGAAIDRLVKEHPYYRHAVVPGGMYNNDVDVQTFGVSATVVTSHAVPEQDVYIVVKSVIEGLDDFRTLHPALGRLKADEMITESLSIPLHDGAARYYQEAGLQ
jgi:TRAP transporter TAXI family solute receptor